MPMATYYNIVTTKELYIEIIPKKLIKFDYSLIYITLKKRLFRVKEGEKCDSHADRFTSAMYL